MTQGRDRVILGLIFLTRYRGGKSVINSLHVNLKLLPCLSVSIFIESAEYMGCRGVTSTSFV